MTDIDVSIVIPLLDEEESLNELHQRIVEVCTSHDFTYEIIFVDDGSRDQSYQVIQDLAAKDENVKALRFRKNYGKSAALSAGFRQVRGQFVFTMDADLQDDPAEIPGMIAKAKEGFDLVSGWKKHRHDPLEKRLPSKFFNKVTALLTGIPIHDFNCGLKVYRRAVTQDIQVYGELHRFLPVLAKWQGYRIGEKVVQHHARQHGVSKFGLARYYRGFFDLLTVLFITRFLKRPMHLFGGLGTISAFIGFIILGYLSIGWFMGHPIGQRPLFFLGILMVIVGIQFFTMGFIGEMITNLKSEQQQYSVQETLNIDSIPRNNQTGEWPLRR